MTLLFVTGAGTDVGKTFVSCRLIRHLPPSLQLRCLKPIVTGFAPTAAASSDPGRLLAAQNRPVTAEAVAAISPWRFTAPLSADMAAAREHRAIDFDALVAFCRSPPLGSSAARSRPPDLTLIEGIGGVMAPIDARHTVLDWIVALQAPVLLVVGSYLGSLSHSLTAVRALTTSRAGILAIVVSQSAEEPVSTAETAATLARFVGARPVLTLPRREDADASALAALVSRHLGPD